MLSWVLRRGLDGVKGANEAGDDTQLDQPETPAPVFAARALKSAIFGEPQRPDDDDTTMVGTNKSDTNGGSRTPTKPTPAGILLTPGTGTSRRKRVSFGGDVVDKGNRVIARKPSLLGDSDTTRRRTRLTELLESSKGDKTTKPATADRKQSMPAISEEQNGDEDEWEEEDDDGPEDDDCCSHDITVDLNEPHSRSGQYWKSNFESYHKDAKSEMEKLLKYKQLAKSYAKLKDAEALDLNEKLKEEQGKVLDMEKKLSEMATQIASRRVTGSEAESSQLLKDLARQTALAVEYRSQVKELESLLRSKPGEHGARQNRRTAASPHTHKTLLETQRELRRARAELREMKDAQRQVARLQADLEAAEERSSKLSEENKRLNRGVTGESSYVKDLMAQLRDAKAESRRKDEELKRLGEEYAAFRTEAVERQEDAKRVLEKATDKISDLKREIRTLKAGKDERATRPRSHHATTALSNGKSAENDLHTDLQSLARLTNSASPPPGPVSRQKTAEQDPDRKRARATQSLRTLREKYLDVPVDADLKLSSDNAVRNVLADRVNLERPKWQPYVPRSPRNRAYLRGMGRRADGLDLNDDFDLNEDDDPVTGKKTSLPLRTDSEEEDEARVDLLRARFKNLGLPNVDDSAVAVGNASKCTLPPDRQAAALARIEQRRAQRRRAEDVGSLKSRDKENVRPTASRENSSW